MEAGIEQEPPPEYHAEPGNPERQTGNRQAIGQKPADDMNRPSRQMQCAGRAQHPLIGGHITGD